MKRKLIFGLVVMLLLFPWTAAYAYGSDETPAGAAVISTAGKNSLPEFKVFGGAIGSVTAGDIFNVDTSGTEIDTDFTLSFTNTDELVKNFRYMTLKIGLYSRNANGGYEKVPSGDIYLTMQNGAVGFSLAGNTIYRISIDKGCFYCYATGASKTAVLPSFYLTVSQESESRS